MLLLLFSLYIPYNRSPAWKTGDSSSNVAVKSLDYLRTNGHCTATNVCSEFPGTSRLLKRAPLKVFLKKKLLREPKSGTSPFTLCCFRGGHFKQSKLFGFLTVRQYQLFNFYSTAKSQSKFFYTALF